MNFKFLNSMTLTLIAVSSMSSIFFFSKSLAQVIKVNKAIEQTIKLKKTDQVGQHDLFAYIGKKNKSLIYFFRDRETDDRKIYSIKIPDYQVTSVSGYKHLLDDFISFPSLHVNEYHTFYSMGTISDTDYGYQKLYLNYLEKDYYLDSIYNADKKIHSSFSSDGHYLLINSLNTLSDYYNPEQDNRVMVYDLSQIDQGEIKKKYIPCTHCSDSYLIGDQLFFTIGREDGYGGFSNKDIYVAPWGSLKDSVKIASNTDILAISPDGKHILGTRFWDRQKTTAVMVDVEQKKYQILLGRDYAKHRAFYSHHENKFAFDFKGYLIYVDFPESYPFDALQWRNEEIPDWTETDFWKQYEHPPLPAN